ncbi:hypothetical protein [Actinomadura miaoliensis]|uniref:DUF3592 domain-containing protein n=1 Tax=Actinomadura miaoliensis TaxID=430685 RepID=A0ABP7X680_9ACTN
MARRRPSHLGTVLLLLAGAYLLYLSVPNVAPAVRAAKADGTPGMFTAQRLQCISHPGHESCSWTGEFRSDDGTIRRADVSLYGSGRNSLHEGERTRAFDIGRESRVYGPDGSREWISIALMILVGAAFFVFALVRVRRRIRTPARESVPVP